MKPLESTLFATSLLLGLCLAPAVTQASPGRDVAAALSLSPRGEVHRFGLVIGNNTTLDRKQSPLKYADDDAARVAELLLEIGADVELVTGFDQDSQEVHGALVAGATRPTKAGLEDAWAKLVTRMQAAKHAGNPVELLIYYSGHGDVGPDGQGFLTLDGAKLTRQDLFGKLLEQSPADHNHVLIDACQSEEFVLSRGKNYKPDRKAKDYSRAVADYLDKRHLGAFPNTGVVLASSVDQQTHEWERYRGGIFTHELLSGLRGGADLNGDGRVEYSELGAFVSAANRGVGDPRARLEVTVRPPKNDERSPIVVHQDVATQRVLLFARSDDNRYTVEDRRGVRLADLNRSGERPGYLRLPPGEVFVYREPHAKQPETAAAVQEAKIPADDGGILLASRLSFGSSTRTARGSLDEAFRDGLFAIPYGPSYYAGYTDNARLLAVAEPEWQVEVWEENEEGELEKVATTTTDQKPEIVAGDGDGKVTVIVHEDEEHWDVDDTWGSLSFGTVMLPFTPEGTFTGQTQRLSANMFNGFADEGFGRYYRGFDTRWYIFGADDYKDYPRVDGFMRLGYEQGSLDFVAQDPDAAPLAPGDMHHAEYHNVPIFLGGNLYAFRRFPIRPYAGAGFGFDVVNLRYQRVDRNDFQDLTARIGFELHAGLDIRLTNFASITAEVRQLWSARKKYDNVPHFRNTGAAAIIGIRVGFPLGEKARRHRGGTTRVEIIEEKGGQTTKTTKTTTQTAPPPSTERLRFADAGNCAEGDCEVTCGDDCKSECLGGDCTQICKAGQTCDFACLGGDCTQTCEPGSACALSCLGEDCVQSCEGASCKR